jgi:hypothetical protein
MLGADANYSLDMESHGARGKWDAKEEEIFTGMQRQGVRWLRVRLWTPTKVLVEKFTPDR